MHGRRNQSVVILLPPFSSRSNFIRLVYFLIAVKYHSEPCIKLIHFFFVSVMFLNEMFTQIKLFSVLFCMAGTIIVSWGDKESEGDAVATNPLLGDVLAIVSAGLYAVYITLIRKKTF